MTTLEVDLGIVRDNFLRARDACRLKGARLVLVTKLARSAPVLVDALVSEGLDSIADSSQRSLARWAGSLRTTLIRYAGEPFEAAFSRAFVSSAAGGRAAAAAGVPVLVCVELGDLREGVNEAELEGFVGGLLSIGARVEGIAANLGCLSGRLPDSRALAAFSRMRETVKRLAGGAAEASIGGTVAWTCLESGALEGVATEIRIGEAVFFGEDTSRRARLHAFGRGAFTLRGRVIEVREKAPDPDAIYGYDAFGRAPSQRPSRSPRRRAVVDFGETVASWTALECVIPGAIPVGATHDYTVVDVTDALRVPEEGGWMEFVASYNAAAHAFSSPEVEVEWKR